MDLNQAAFEGKMLNSGLFKGFLGETKAFLHRRKSDIVGVAPRCVQTGQEMLCSGLA